MRISAAQKYNLMSVLMPQSGAVRIREEHAAKQRGAEVCPDTAPILGRRKNIFLLASRGSVQLFGRSRAARFFSAAAVAVTEGRRSKCVKSSQLNASFPKCFFSRHY